MSLFGDLLYIVEAIEVMVVRLVCRYTGKKGRCAHEQSCLLASEIVAMVCWDALCDSELAYFRTIPKN